MSAIAPPPFDPRELVLPSVLAMLADVATQLEHPTAQTVHLLAQIAQALDSVHLLAPAKLVRSLEQACQLPRPAPAPERHASSTTLPTTDTAQHLPALRQLAYSDLLRYLEAIAHQQPADTAQLFDSYRALVRLSGKDSAHPADLWEQRPDHAALAELPAEITNRYPTLVPCDAVRAELDQAVLAWVKAPAPGHAATLCHISLGLAHSAPTPALRCAWQLVAGWWDAQAAALLPPDIYAKRLAARVLMLYGQQLKGASAATTPLLDELRFFCAQGVQKLQHAPLDSAPIFSAICLVYELIPAPTAPQKEAAAEQAPPAPAPTALPEPAPPPGHAAPVLELQPLATLTQGLAGQPQTPAKASAITPAQTLVHALNTALSDGRDPGPACEAAGGTANNAEAKAEGDADTDARTSAAQLTRYAWEQGWAEIAMLAHLIERITQRAPTPWPAALRTTCQHGTTEIERLLQQLAQGHTRRAQAQIVQALEHAVQQLPAPAAVHESAEASESEAATAENTTDKQENNQNPIEEERNQLQTLHFSVLEEEMQAQWPQLQAALHSWPPGSACPPALLRALHTLKGSARLAGAAAWARQVHALETLAFAPHSSPEALAEPIEALRLGFAALQQEMALHAPQAPSQQQPLETLQRHTQALWISHTQAQEATAQSQSAITEMAASLQRLHTLVQDCKVWANTLMVYGDMELSYEWHSELQDLLAGLLSATDDLGTVQQQLQHHHQESTHALATQTGYLQGLQHSLLYASLQPLGHIQERLAECLRLAEHDCQRQADLHLEGEAILLEKTTLQALAPALEHLLRNSLAHGIEAPAQRRAAGKPAHGQITLALREANGQHILTLSDDGAGLDLNAIGRQAARLGLWQGAEPPTAEQAAQLIVHPQLSTAAALSETAGRGIGMDAVQAQIQALGGQLHIASRTGQGCTTTITLPAPPAVLPIQVLRAGSWQVALPSQWIEGVLRIPLSLAEEGLQRGMLHGDPRGPLPLFWAGALWQQSACSQLPPLDGHVHILIVRSPTQRWGLWVDSLQPTQEVLLQPPTGLTTPIAGLLGTASLPSGQVVPVYEPAPVIAAHENRQHSAHPAPLAHPEAMAEEPQRPLVMLVDDSISVRRLAQHLLISHGWQVETAADGLAALQRLHEGLQPSVMLVDIEMPGMNGLELLRRLRQEPRWQQLSVVMLTAHEAGPVSQQALDMGAQAYLTKPYSPQQLLAQVKRYAAAVVD